MLIGISGYARSGKDTLASAIISAYPEFDIQRVAFADKVRDLAIELDPLLRDGSRLSTVVSWHGWEGAKSQNPNVRPYLQRLGAAVRDVLGEDAWVDASLPPTGVFEINSWTYVDPPSFVVTDVRYPNEAREIVRRGGKVVRVYRPGVGPANDHPSELAMDDWAFDTTVVNDSTPEHMVDCLRGAGILPRKDTP